MKIINSLTEGNVQGVSENHEAYNIVENEKEDSAEITMYGQVVTNRPRDYWSDEKNKGLYIVLGEFLEDLEKIKERSKITVRINSPGGELYAGLTIMNRLSELKGDVVTIVDGLAASAASIILQGGKTRRVHNGSMVMVHGASLFLYGSFNKAKMEEAVKQLDAANRAAIEAYSQRMNVSKDEIREVMEKTEWMTGQEAINKGFADEMIDTGGVSMSISQDNAYMVVNGIMMSTEGLETLPEGIRVDKEMVIPGIKPVVADKKSEGGQFEMTEKELREKYPELVAKIEEKAALQGKEDGEKGQESQVADAVCAERKRISEIEEIANAIGDRELLHKAKFDTPMTAAELALEAMKQQARQGENFMKNSSEDIQKSGVGAVIPVPGAGMKEEMEQSDIMAGAKLIAGIKEGE